MTGNCAISTTGQCQQALNASCYGNTRESDVGAGKIERLRNNNSGGGGSRDGSGFACGGLGHGSILAAPQGYSHCLDASPSPVLGRGWAEVGDVVQQARNRSHQ